MNKLLGILLLFILFSCERGKSNNVETMDTSHANNKIFSMSSLSEYNQLWLSKLSLNPEDTKNMTHYFTNNINLYIDSDSTSIITTLPQYSTFRIIETGKTETINDITAPWIKIMSQTGFSGWCFSGYVRQLEDDLTNEITRVFRSRSGGGAGDPLFWSSNTGSRRYNVTGSNVSSFESIVSAQGYYIQQAERKSNQGHSPEILVLIIEDENIFIREIDIIDKQIITRNEISLYFNGNTFVHNNTKLEMLGENLQIIYHEHRSERNRTEAWDFNMPYTFAGNLDSPMPHSVQRLTTDYLLSYVGEYVFDSYEILGRDTRHIIDTESVFRISYNQEKKCLSVSNNHIIPSSFQPDYVNTDFIQTTSAEPFYWLFGEAAGFIEVMTLFYKGGIIFYYNDATVISEYESNSISYFVFYKKVH